MKHRSDSRKARRVRSLSHAAEIHRRSAATLEMPTPALLSVAQPSSRRSHRSTVNHIAYTIADWDAKKVEEVLKARGLNPRPDTPHSFHVMDPYGYDLQISGIGMTAFN